jgi:hypothetical protein
MKYHGRKGEIAIAAAISPAGSPDTLDYTAVASLSEWSLSFSRDKIDVTSFQDTNKTYLVGLKDCSGSFSGFFDSATIATLFNAGDDTDGVWIKITPSTDLPTVYFQGPSWLDLTVTGSVNDAVKVSGSFSANGAWEASLA